MQKYDVLIVGGGAAGLACAARLSENKNLKIVIAEAGDRVGKKLAATGNGQGNVSNIRISPENFRGGDAELIKNIACGKWDDGLDVFSNMLFSADSRGRVYPLGRQASALVDNLLFTLKSRGVKILLSARVESLKKGFIARLSNGEEIAAAFAVLAVGGKAQRQFKTDGSSYSLAEGFGHKITRLFPSLVQLKCDTSNIRSLKGVRCDCLVTAKSCAGKTTARGDVIFTDYGVSGNAIFSVSPVFSSDRGEITIDFAPDVGDGELIALVAARKAKGVADGELLSGLVHNQIGRAVVRRAGGDPAEIVKTFKNFTLEVVGTLGFDYAQVTRGGVDLRDITPNLESKLQKNLYFAGEVLDVDGDCGGYNLHWAFTSAKRVAEEILSKC